MHRHLRENNCDNVCARCIVYYVAYLGPGWLLNASFLLGCLTRALGQSSGLPTGCSGSEVTQQKAASHIEQTDVKSNLEALEHAGRHQKLRWPHALDDILLCPSVTAAFIATLVSTYALIQMSALLPGSFMYQVPEMQSTREHTQNLLQLLARGLLIYSMSNMCCIRDVDLKKAVAIFVFELISCLGFFANCSSYLAHSMTTGTALKAFDLSVVGFILFNLAALFTCAVRRLTCKSSIVYLVLFVTILVVHTTLYIGLPGIKFHNHHYHIATILGVFCIFDEAFARMGLIKSIVLLLEGISTWGADSLFLDSNLQPVVAGQYVTLMASFFFLFLLPLRMLYKFFLPGPAPGADKGRSDHPVSVGSEVLDQVCDFSM